MNFNFPDAPKWMATSIQYCAIMGSQAYGVARPDSDEDLYLWCIPPRQYLIPHLNGYIVGLDKYIPVFDQYQKKVNDSDVTIYSVLKYFYLLQDGNPNILDSLFTPINCIKYISKVGSIVRDHRHLFLSKLCYHRFRGYAFSQLSKIENKKSSDYYLAVENYEKENGIPHTCTFQEAQDNKYNLSKMNYNTYVRLYQVAVQSSNRFENIKVNGYDTKFAYHVVRLMLECKQILEEYDLVLDNNVEILTEIRNGEWSLEQINNFFKEKLKETEELYAKSSVLNEPPYKAIKSLYKEVINVVYQDIYNDR